MKAPLQIFLLLLLMMGGAVAAPVDDVRLLWDTYVKLERAFDPAVADLYSDRAVCTNTRRYPDGTSKLMTMSGSDIKKLIVQVAPISKQKGDANTYSNVDITPMAGGRYKISATRFSLMKKYSSPMTWIVGQEFGKWVILEEHSESRP